LIAISRLTFTPNSAAAFSIAAASSAASMAACDQGAIESMGKTSSSSMMRLRKIGRL
jgi:hypothetical protein